MPRKRISGSSTNSKSSDSPSTSVRRSTRTKRDEPKDEQLSDEEAVQEVFSENEETRPKLSLPKKRTKPTSLVSKSTRTKKARNEDEQQQAEEVKVDENPDNGSQVSETIKGKNNVTEQPYDDNTEDASTTESISLS